MALNECMYNYEYELNLKTSDFSSFLKKRKVQ